MAYEKHFFIETPLEDTSFMKGIDDVVTLARAPNECKTLHILDYHTRDLDL